MRVMSIQVTLLFLVLSFALCSWAQNSGHTDAAFAIVTSSGDTSVVTIGISQSGEGGGGRDTTGGESIITSDNVDHTKTVAPSISAIATFGGEDSTGGGIVDSISSGGGSGRGGKTIITVSTGDEGSVGIVTMGGLSDDGGGEGGEGGHALSSLTTSSSSTRSPSSSSSSTTKVVTGDLFAIGRSAVSGVDPSPSSSSSSSSGEGSVSPFSIGGGRVASAVSGEKALSAIAGTGAGEDSSSSSSSSTSGGHGGGSGIGIPVVSSGIQLTTRDNGPIRNKTENNNKDLPIHLPIGGHGGGGGGGGDNGGDGNGEGDGDNDDNNDNNNNNNDWIKVVATKPGDRIRDLWTYYDTTTSLFIFQSNASTAAPPSSSSSTSATSESNTSEKVIADVRILLSEGNLHYASFNYSNNNDNDGDENDVDDNGYISSLTNLSRASFDFFLKHLSLIEFIEMDMAPGFHPSHDRLLSVYPLWNVSWIDHVYPVANSSAVLMNFASSDNVINIEVVFGGRPLKVDQSTLAENDAKITYTIQYFNYLKAIGGNDSQIALVASIGAPRGASQSFQPPSVDVSSHRMNIDTKDYHGYIDFDERADAYNAFTQKTMMANVHFNYLSDVEECASLSGGWDANTNNNNVKDFYTKPLSPSRASRVARGIADDAKDDDDDDYKAGCLIVSYDALRPSLIVYDPKVGASPASPSDDGDEVVSMSSYLPSSCVSVLGVVAMSLLAIVF
eukprot:TRINITY_DN1251_c0_g1_i1.p1 TRINITY_DN1251_c0_g1~~TRINITY_DN1251_c0_g1_i1.p1  ORF type:complete len:728 (+),score=209.68 TRINITY_DN1251_c0_g1_i1:172-2355(+)